MTEIPNVMGLSYDSVQSLIGLSYIQRPITLWVILMYRVTPFI